MRLKRLLPLLLAAVMIFTAGCSSLKNKEPEKLEWDPTSYTMEEILAKAYDSPKKVKRFKKKKTNGNKGFDDSPESLAKYNLILGYLENVLDVKYTIDYIVRDDQVYETDSYTYYTIGIILDGYGENDSIPMFFNGETQELQSSVELFYTFENRWNDLNEELGKIVPGAEAAYIDRHHAGGFIGVNDRPEYLLTHDWQAYYEDRPEAVLRDAVIFMPKGSKKSDGEALYANEQFTALKDKYRLVDFTIADSKGGKKWKLEYEE